MTQRCSAKAIINKSLHLPGVALKNQSQQVAIRDSGFWQADHHQSSTAKKNQCRSCAHPCCQGLWQRKVQKGMPGRPNMWNNRACVADDFPVSISNSIVSGNVSLTSAQPLGSGRALRCWAHHFFGETFDRLLILDQISDLTGSPWGLNKLCVKCLWVAGADVLRVHFL